MGQFLSMIACYLFLVAVDCDWRARIQLRKSMVTGRALVLWPGPAEALAAELERELGRSLRD